MRNASLLELRTWARQLSDTEGDPFVTDEELSALANRHLTELYDRLVDAGPPERYAATVQTTTTAGLAQVPLPVDFRSLLDVYQVSNGVRRTVSPMRNGTRGNYREVPASTTLEIEYIPSPPVLEDDGDTFDGVSGWEELIANLMARDVMIKRESDPSVVLNNIARLELRIQTRSRSRDKGSPKRITDLDEVRDDWWYFDVGGTSRPLVYRLRGDNIEIYERFGVYA